MKKKSALLCMLLCMYLIPVLANEISPVKASNHSLIRMATIRSGVSMAIPAGWYVPIMVASSDYGEEIDLVFTDNSYDDVSYSISRREEGSATWQLVFEFNAPDSGSVFYFDDHLLKPGTRYTYSVSVNLQDGSSLSDVVVITAATIIDTPDIKYDNMHIYDCGTEIPIAISYITSGAYTEIYHSNSATGPWELVETLPPGIDNALFHAAPRRTHFYRARGTNAARDIFSAWSAVMSHHIESDWYDPIFTITVRPDRTVDIVLVHKTFVNTVYDITRMSGDGYNITSGLETADSGAVYTFHDTLVEAGNTYEYILMAYQSPILCVGWPGGGDRDSDIVHLVITIPPDDYTIAGFTLVDPVTEQDIGPLNNGAYFEANQLPNIRANVGPKVKSVIFFLNNKRRTDNGPPLFTYWPAGNGDYAPGVWLPTTYNLKATAYSEKNGKGIKGTTLEINFQIKASVHLDSLVLIDPVTNQPIRRLMNFDTVDASLNANIRAYTSSNAKCVTFFLNNKRRTDNGPPVFTYFALSSGGLSTPGQYLLKSTPSTEKNGGGLVGYTFYTNFTVTCSTCATPLLAESDAEETIVALYPNPIVQNSRLLVNAPTATTVNVQVYDQFGNAVGKQIDAAIDGNGEYQLPLKELQLNKGAYILSVKIDGTRTVKRIVVE